MLLARPGALALVALGVARACDCPWQFDGECDVGNGCDCDPFDCSECGRLVTCEACASRGDCVYCAAESLCAPADDVPTPAFLAGHGKVSTCAPDDFVATCGTGAAASPDPYYGAAAWYLDLMNVEAAWASGVTGAGVRIRVNDDGIDASHPDLAKVSVADSCELWAPLEEAGEDHGTACAALAAASANDHCGVGVAPGASLSACAIYGNHESPEAADGSYLYVGDNDVSSNSYGVDSCVFSGVYYYYYDYYDWTYDDDWWSGSGGTAAGRKPDAARKDKSRSKDKTARRSRRDFDFGFDFDFDFEAAAACPFSSEEVCGACDGDDWASGSLSDACEDAVVGWCTHDLDFETDPEACLDFDEYFVTCGHGQLSRSEAAAFRRGVTEGRGGKGTVYVFSAGNEHASGDDVNFEGELQSRYTMSIAAVGRDGLHASYSSVGAPVFAAAPGGDGDHVHNMVTALPPWLDRADDCGDVGMGTSYAAPLVAGVVALVLEANPDLGWRDVFGVVATTSRLPDDAGDPARSLNAAAVGHSYQYGFGVVDAGAAVAAARTWATYGPEKVLASKTYANRALPDFGGAGEAWVASTEATGFAGHGDFVVEHVAVLLTVAHERRGDVRVILERGGVESVLARDSPELGDGYDEHKYTTPRHWGERADAGGAFTLRLADMRAGAGDGVFVSWTLQVYGHTVEPESGGAVLASDGAAPRAATAGAAVAAAALLLFGAL